MAEILQVIEKDTKDHFQVLRASTSPRVGSAVQGHSTESRAGDICVLQRLFRGRAVINIRTDSKVLLYFDIRATLADGVPVYVSPNNVVLIEGFNRSLPNKYKQPEQANYNGPQSMVPL